MVKGESWGPRVRLVVGGEREGWLSWSSLLEGVESKHTHVKTHKDQVGIPTPFPRFEPVGRIQSNLTQIWILVFIFRLIRILLFIFGRIRILFPFFLGGSETYF